MKKMPHDRILGEKPKKQHLNTILKSCLYIHIYIYIYIFLCDVGSVGVLSFSFGLRY